jgi:dTMP kinase
MDKKLICITGIDGTGKSTLIKGVLKHFGNFYHATIWDLMTSSAKGLPFKSKTDIDDFLCSLTLDSRLLFLAHCLKYALDKAFESTANSILIDSYYFKYFATEKALGANEQLIHSLELSFPTPDLVIELLLPVENCSQRKNNFSRYECGLAGEPDILSFINFQKKALLEWNRFDRANWFRIDAQKDPESILGETIKMID